LGTFSALTSFDSSYAVSVLAGFYFYYLVGLALTSVSCLGSASDFSTFFSSFAGKDFSIGSSSDLIGYSTIGASCYLGTWGCKLRLFSIG